MDKRSAQEQMTNGAQRGSESQGAMQAFETLRRAITDEETTRQIECMTPSDARRLAQHLGKAAELLGLHDDTSTQTSAPTPRDVAMGQTRKISAVSEVSPQPQKKADVLETAIVPPEQTIESEPAHVQLTDAYIEKLGIAQDYRGAFEGLIDPNNKGELSDNKRDVVNMIREAIGHSFGDEDVINQLEAGGKGGAIAVRRLLGVYHQNTRQVLKDPVQLHDQIKNFADTQQATYVDNFNATFEELLTTLQIVES